MNEPTPTSPPPSPRMPEVDLASARRIAMICYALYALSPLVGGVTALAAIIINYLKRGEFANTWVATHIQWQIKTFWWTLLGSVIGWVLVFILIGFPILLAVSLWALYRIVKGWLALYEGRPVDPQRWF
ncbi:MAG: hypothetical protein RI906_1435 [Pseudomonadota bacterium]|jgi:uncharacterized membrane protein